MDRAIPLVKAERTVFRQDRINREILDQAIRPARRPAREQPCADALRLQPFESGNSFRLDPAVFRDRLVNVGKDVFRGLDGAPRVRWAFSILEGGSYTDPAMKSISGSPMTILYFARLRDEIGASEEKLSPPEHVKTVGELMAWLRGRSAAHGHALGPGAMLKVAVNQTYANPETPVATDDEIAIFPPVTGG